MTYFGVYIFVAAGRAKVYLTEQIFYQMTIIR